MRRARPCGVARLPRAGISVHRRAPVSLYRCSRRSGAPAIARRALHPTSSRRDRRGGWRSARLRSDAVKVSSDVGARRDVARRAQGPWRGGDRCGAWLGTRSHLAGGRGGTGWLLGVARKGGTKMGTRMRGRSRLRTPGPAPLVRTRAEQPCGWTRRGIQWDVKQQGGRRAVCPTTPGSPGRFGLGVTMWCGA